MAKTFTVTLADGTQLADLELNGNNFISQKEVTEETFSGKLSHVVITGDAEADDCGLIGEHQHMELIQCIPYGGNYWFVLRELTAPELKELERDARLDYLEMINDVEA